MAYGLGLTNSVILAQDFHSFIRRCIENVRLGAYIGCARVLSYGKDQLCIRRTPLSVLGTSGGGGGSVLGTSTGFASDVIKQISEAVRYSQEHNNTQ